MTDPIQAAVEKVEEACPCRPAHDDVLMDIGIRTIQPCVNGCICYFGKVSIKPTTACLWPGHAAIRSLAEVAKLAGDQERQAKMMRAYHATLDTIGAPSDEWPCNRASKMALALRESEARLGESRKGRAALVREYGHVRQCSCCDLKHPQHNFGQHHNVHVDPRCLPESREEKP